MNLSGVRNAIVSKIDALSGFRQTPFPVEMFDRSQNTLAHLGFNVSLQSTQAADERQRVPSRVFMSTNASVIFAYRIRPHSISTDYNLAMDKEVEVITAILGSYVATAGIELRYNQSTRRFAQSLEYALIQIDLNILHTP